MAALETYARNIGLDLTRSGRAGDDRHAAALTRSGRRSAADITVPRLVSNGYNLGGAAAATFSRLVERVRPNAGRPRRPRCSWLNAVIGLCSLERVSQSARGRSTRRRGRGGGAQRRAVDPLGSRHLS